MEKGRKVVVFGIFDGAHEGHRFLFKKAREYGDILIAAVGRDEYVKRFKNKEPKNSEQDRIDTLLKEGLVDKAYLSDKEVSSYNILSEIKPDIICFGYDQDVLEEDLKKWMEINGIGIKTVKLPKFQKSLQKENLAI